MPANYLEYQLQNGYIHNWLVAGPQAVPVDDLERFEGPDLKLQIARHKHERDSGIAQDPTERDTFAVGDTTLTWQYASCGDDHFVDLTAFYHTCHYLRAWAYAELICPAAQSATLVLTTNGPADLWLNGQHIQRQELFAHQIPRSVPFQAMLQEGRSQILVRFEGVAVRECPYAMALRIVELAHEPTPVQLPTPVEQVARRQLLERVFEAAYLDRDVYTKHDHDHCCAGRMRCARPHRWRCGSSDRRAASMWSRCERRRRRLPSASPRATRCSTAPTRSY